MCRILFISIVFLISNNVICQHKDIYRNDLKIPNVYSGIQINNSGNPYFVSMKKGDTSQMENSNPFYTLDNIRITPKANDKGLFFDFQNKEFYGTIYYGFYPDNKAKYKQPVYFKQSSRIIQGKADINIEILKGKFDIANFNKTGKARVGYRILNNYGEIIYDGVIEISGKEMIKVDLSIIAGPYINKVTDSTVVISFETNSACDPQINVSNKTYSEEQNSNIGKTHHEILIDGLMPKTEYEYDVSYGDNMQSYVFETAPKSGTRNPFTFAFTSDSRNGNGGGERNIYGVNAYIMKRMAVLGASNNVAFFQFTGDMINGYSSSVGETNLQYANWKKAIEPYWHYIPFNVGIGNHESVVNSFNNGSKYGISVDKFPFQYGSTETVFLDNFVNPEADLISEDGAYYDPKPHSLDFPNYGETVYYYIYDNIAMVVLNSEYWYTPSTSMIPEIGGNPHGYIMDNQLKWFSKTIDLLNSNTNIDHIFVTIHTPAFPNGGHAGDDMWYNGNNSIRPTVAGIPVKKGIIERRDEFLDVMINKSNKVVALLCGDEHNYSRTKLTKSSNIYNDNYKGKKLKVGRTFWQITNGSAGAPYYGQENLPWSESVEIFSTQYALNLFDINGKKIRLRVINPDTLEEIETIILIP